jgi:phage shock protein A
MEKEHLASENNRKQQLIKSLHQELGGEEAELDDDEDDPLIHRIRRECAMRVKDCEDRLKKSQTEGEMQSILLDKMKHDLREAREEADDAQRGAVTMFNEQKRYELNIQRLQSDVHQARTASDKMRTEAVNLRVKIQELRDERADRQRLYDGAVAENQAALEERDSTIADLRSLLDRRRRELDELEQSIARLHSLQSDKS